jgi:hypothetical protein
MIMKHLSAVVILAASFLGTVAVTSASAQIARDGNYYEETRTGSCSAGAVCELQFTAVPQLILFSKINCFITAAGGALYAATFEIRDASGAGGPSRRREFLQFPPASTIGTTNYYSFVSPTDFLISASKFPVIEGFISSGSGFIECKITGRLQ